MSHLHLLQLKSVLEICNMSSMISSGASHCNWVVMWALCLDDVPSFVPREKPLLNKEKSRWSCTLYPVHFT